MKRSNLWISWLMLFLIGSFSGCGWLGSDEEEVPLDETLQRLSDLLMHDDHQVL